MHNIPGRSSTQFICLQIHIYHLAPKEKNYDWLINYASRNFGSVEMKSFKQFKWGGGASALCGCGEVGRGGEGRRSNLLVHPHPRSANLIL